VSRKGLTRLLAVSATTLSLGAAATAPAAANVSVSVNAAGAANAVKHVMPAIGALAPGGHGDAGVGCIGCGVGPLMYGGGPVQHAPQVYIAFWGWGPSTSPNDPAGVAPYLQRFFNGVGGTGWANIQTQYTDGSGAVGNPGGQLKGVWFDTTDPIPANPLADAAVANEGLAAAAHFGYNADADYIVATPTGISTGGFVANGGSYCAYHSSANDGQGRPVAFTNLPYMPDGGTGCGRNFVNPGSAGLLDGVSIVGGHEYAETITDPGVGSGWTDVEGQETGDKCAWIGSGSGASRNITLSTGTFAVQTLFSNAGGLLGDCVITYP
jgi:serine protease